MLPLGSMPPDSPGGSRRRSRRARGLRPGVDRLEPRTLPATFVANSLLDEPDAEPGDGFARTANGTTTLRAAIMEANALVGPDVIVLPAGTYQLSIGASTSDDSDDSGDLDVFGAITIRGAGGGLTAIVGDGSSRLFDFDNSGDAVLSGVMLRGGRDSEGGAIRIRGSVELKISGSTFRDNRAVHSGGAIHADASTRGVTLVDCFFESNEADDSGGAIYAVARDLSIAGSTFADNAAGYGGAAASYGGDWIVARSTFNGNHAIKRGGAIDFLNGGSLSLASSTLTENTAGLGGGGIAASEDVELVNTILAGNSCADGPDGLGAFRSLGHNLVGNVSGIEGLDDLSDLVGTPSQPLDPLLTGLSYFGGITPTRVPLPGSPALDAGLTEDAADQRGIARPAGAMDIGAVEARTFTLSRLEFRNTATVGTSYGRLRVCLMEGDVGLPGVVVSFAAPTGGAGGSFAGPATAITDDDGIAESPPLLANATAGEFDVHALITGGMSLDFRLRNRPGAAARIDLQGPAEIRAGEPGQYTLAVRDLFGNLIESRDEKVVVTSTDARGRTPRQFYLGESDHGSASFGATFLTAGSHSLRVAIGSLTADAKVRVSPAAASRIDLAVAAQVRAGVATPVTLTVRDQYGNLATDFNGTVALTGSDPTSTQLAAIQFTAADRGVKTVSLTFRQAGLQTVTATGDSFTATANVTVTPAAATRFELNAPNTAVAGESILLIVTARDAFGNVASDFRGRVDFLSDDSRSTLPSNESFGPDDAGVKLFSLTFRTAGPRSATFGAGGLQSTYRLTVSPAALSRFTLTAPSAVDEGSTFSATVTAFDAFGNVATNYAGTIGVASDDPRAGLPAPIAFTTADAGVRTVTGLSLRSPGARSLNVIDTVSSVRADAQVAVRNLGPRNLALSTDPSSIREGDSLTLLGTFANIDTADTHTVVIRWGDGSADTILNLAAGVTTFEAAHRFTDNAPNAGIHVTVTDADGGTVAGDQTVTVANVAPTVSVPAATSGTAIGRIGDLFAVGGSFADPGLDAWSATVDYGDGRGPQPLALSGDKRFQLRHVYTAEGTFTVVVSVTDGDGGRATFTERVAILLPGTANVRMIVVGPGERGTINTSNYDVEFINASRTKPAVFLAGLVDLKTVSQIPDSPTVGDGGKLFAVDFRALDADPASKLTIVLHYDPTGVLPELRYFDAATGDFVPVRGSTRFADSFVIDRVNHTVTVTIDGSTSSPTLSQLNGTLFTLSVPAPPPPTPQPAPTPPVTPQQAFFVQANSIGPLASSDASGVRPSAAITGLSSGGEVTFTLSSSDGLRRGGSDTEGQSPFETSLLPVVQFVRKIYAVQNAIAEAIRMWFEHPAPMEAPALVPPPPHDDVWQISLDVPAAARHVDAPAEIESALAEERLLLIDASAAVADHQPWWLADAAPASPTEPSRDSVNLSQITSEPTDDERVAAAVAAIWIGGHALAISAPEKPSEDRVPDPRRKVRPKLRVPMSER